MGLDSRYMITLIFIVFLAAALFVVNKYYKEKNKSANLHSRKNEYEELLIDIESYREEISHLLFEIKELKESGESIEALLKKSEEYQLKVITGIPEVDLLLLYKAKFCREKGIIIEYEITKMKNMILEVREYFSLFGNLIDNGMEASVKCSLKEITVQSRIIKGVWFLKVVNTKLEEEHPIESGMVTTKSDAKNHGVGSRVVDEIAKKYDGTVKRYDQGEYFEVVLAIPVGEA